MASVLISLGALLILSALLAPTRSLIGATRHTRSFTTLVIAAVLALVGSSVLPAPAARGHHTQTTSNGTVFAPTNWNGLKIYLSSARHATSGSRGECGWEENRNARNWNMYAADGANIPNIRSRGYYVQVSPNNREAPEGQGAVKNKDASNNWGAHVHIVTHTNASPAGGCPQTAQYLLVLYRTGVANSTGLRTELITRLDPIVPGGNNTFDCDAWTECTNVIATHRAYVELFFHTNQAAVNWFQAGGGGHGVSAAEAWRYGWAIDVRLGYPR